MIKKTIGENALSQLEKYFIGIEKFSNLESNLVRSADYLNNKTANLYVQNETSKLKTLSEIILYGFMQYSVYDLYRMSLSNMPLEEELQPMGNRLFSHDKNSFIKEGFTEIDLNHIKRFNESMSVLIEKLLEYEGVYKDLNDHINYISFNEGEDFAQELSGFIEYEYGAVGGVAYLSALHASQKDSFSVDKLIPEMGFTTIGYKKYIK